MTAVAGAVAAEGVAERRGRVDGQCERQVERLPTGVGREVGPAAARAVHDLELNDPAAAFRVPPRTCGAHECPLPVHV